MKNFFVKNKKEIVRLRLRMIANEKFKVRVTGGEGLAITLGKRSR
jgi:hypothetical protein